MKVNQVPQDDANIFDGKTQDVQYALDENGKYTIVKSVGWQPKNDAISHAWELEQEKIEEARALVVAGKKSPIYYHMFKNLMDVKLLASYTGFFVFTVKRHFKPNVFNELSEKKLQRYVEAFRMKHIDDLYNIE
ncbi:MAG: hypothetical protein IPO21_13800 [Bacteroidales bacterium]|nr:hypothetical protein [Bacteroidales bacterium]